MESGCECQTNKDQLAERLVRNDAFHSLRLNYQAPNGNTLGNLNQFCQAFFHIKETREIGLDAHCISGNCSNKVAVILLRIGDFIKRYTNCRDKFHAEDFLFNDPEIDSFLKKEKIQSFDDGYVPPVAKLYMNLQPCHFSSNDGRKSCSLNLIKFKRKLRKYGCDLELIVSYPYRTHWDEAHLDADERKRYSRKIENARIGTKLLRKEIKMRAFVWDDYLSLLPLCDADVSDQFFKFDGIEELIQKRTELDQFTQSIFEKYA